MKTLLNLETGDVLRIASADYDELISRYAIPYRIGDIVAHRGSGVVYQITGFDNEGWAEGNVEGGGWRWTELRPATDDEILKFNQETPDFIVIVLRRESDREPVMNLLKEEGYSFPCNVPVPDAIIQQHRSLILHPFDKTITVCYEDGWDRKPGEILEYLQGFRKDKTYAMIKTKPSISQALEAIKRYIHK